MKLLLLFVAVGVAIGYPTNYEIFEPVPEQILQKPMTELRYEELLPVVKETLTTLLRRTIPPGCTHVAIPCITVGMVGVHTGPFFRDVYRILRTEAVGDLAVLDALRLSPDTPIDVHLSEINNILLEMRKRVSVRYEIPMPTKGLNHVTPAEVELIEIYHTLATLLNQYVTELTTVLPLREPIPFGKLLRTLLTGTIDIQTYWEVPTLKQWITVMTTEIQKLLPALTPEMCQTVDVLPRLIPRIENLLTRIETLSVSKIMGLLPTTAYTDATYVQGILYKLLPIVKETTPITKLVSTLRTPSFETNFMHYVINFISERVATVTVEKINTKDIITKFLTTNEGLLIPAIQKVLSPARIDPVAINPFIKLLAKMTVMMRIEGLPLIDCVEIIARTLDITTTDMYSMMEPISDMYWKNTNPVSVGSWESMEYMETRSEESIGSLLKNLYWKIKRHL